MKQFLALTVFAAATLGLFSQQSAAQPRNFDNRSKSYFIDVHHFGAGKVTAKEVEAAHQKDLAIEKKYRVTILKYWFDEAKGDVYCLHLLTTQNLSAKHMQRHTVFYQMNFTR
jgi:hypothetical protein